MLRIDGLPVYEWVVNDEDETDGVRVMSLVDDPAVEKYFVAYKRNQKKPVYAQIDHRKRAMKYSLDQNLHVVTGVALRANFPIYRNDNYGEYYTIFNKETIRQIVYKFMKQLRNCSVSIDHEEHSEGAFLFESFIWKKGHEDVYPEFKDVEDGSWMVSYKIEDEELWEKIQKGGINGFSVEMYGFLAPILKEILIPSIDGIVGGGDRITLDDEVPEYDEDPREEEFPEIDSTLIDSDSDGILDDLKDKYPSNVLTISLAKAQKRLSRFKNKNSK